MNHFATPISRWAKRSQQRACRNAMVASTALTDARRERTEVEQYVVGTLARRQHARTDRTPRVRTASGG